MIIKLDRRISCPMQELKLLVYSQGKRVYNKTSNINEIPPQIFYYLILESLSDTYGLFAHQVYVNDLKFKNKSVGNVSV